MWLKRSGWQCIQSRKKSHCSNGDGREPGCFNIVYSQMCSTHKKSALEFLLISSKTYLVFLIRFSYTQAQTFVQILQKLKIVYKFKIQVDVAQALVNCTSVVLLR